ncbi:NO-binding membrane sensor protein with MHYT domain [Rhizobium sp. SG_E_25_P2]|uniref:MHYT domain-containing protein n=1 Tax=Rhizobium sp. SG_E_25_P2 TaxID=2879942 RepID=UPI0024754A40|nr:MHYT domain-containing protein [Rhizobium sp. SG_E_25_P2]MDH6269763.1 NO-binding membrane sensor protein with MHYT domain [Rhizobium sp. SG_E_25_P2]
MLAGHNPYLVALSLAIAVLGGYTGLGLAGRILGKTDWQRRALLVGAAGFLSTGIWTMHFIGMLAAPLPADIAYLVLPTIVSFLICALVVGVSIFFVVGSRPGTIGTGLAALLLGLGICSMHYVGIHGLAGHFAIEHDPFKVLLSVVIATATAYGALRIFLDPQVGLRLAISAVAFGLAVSGMHYTAMWGMHVAPAGGGHDMAAMGASFQMSSQFVSLVVACLCFLVTAGFLLFLLPEQWGRAESQPALVPADRLEITEPPAFDHEPPPMPPQQRGRIERIPVQSGGATQFIPISDVRSLRADAHYTWVHDGNRERMCGWSISEAEAALDPTIFIRVHRSHIVAMPHVTQVRKEGDAAVVELNGAHPHQAPVSRARVAEVKARLGLTRSSA